MARMTEVKNVKEKPKHIHELRRQDAQREVEHGQAGCDSTTCSPWWGADWIECKDGKNRPVEPGLMPLAYGVSCRAGRLRAYGNAIVPQVAAEFVKAAISAIDF